MKTKDLNRLKVVLAEKKRTNKWLAEQLGKDPATISKWCTNNSQPTLENLLDIARCLDVTVNDLVRMGILQAVITMPTNKNAQLRYQILDNIEPFEHPSLVSIVTKV